MKNNVFVISSNETSESEHLTIETFNIGDHAWKRREIDGDDGFLCQKNLNSSGYWVGK